MRHYVGPFVPDDSEEVRRWTAPSASLRVGTLSLHSHAQAGHDVETGIGHGHAIFTYNVDPADPALTFLGEDFNAPLRTSMKQDLGDAIGNGGVSFSGGASTLADCLWEAFTVAADPTGATGLLPILGTRRHTRQLALNGVIKELVLSTNPLDPSPGWDIALLALQHIYRRLEGQVRAGLLPTATHQKMLWHWERQYELPASAFIPPDLPDVPSVRPSTSVSDNFNRTNEALEDSANWTKVLGNASLQVVSNELSQTHTTNDTSYNSYQTALATANHFAELSIEEHGVPGGLRSWWGAIVRGDNTADNHLIFQSTKTTSATQRRLIKRVSGSNTTLVDTSETHSLPEIYRLEFSGTLFTTLIASVIQDGPTTETDLGGNLYVGLAGYRGGEATFPTMRADDWAGGDLAAGVEIFRRRIEGY